VRKPQGLSNDLKAGEDFVNNNEAKIELMMKGFTPTQGAAGGPPEIISSDGEVVATMKNGTEYVLRFGNLTSADREKAEEAAAGQPADPAAAAAAAAKPADEKKNSDVHRYLFVMARFNKDAVKKPETQPLPELPKDEEKPADAAPAENKDGEDASAAAQPAEAAATDEAKKEESKDAVPDTDNADKPADAADAEKKDGEAASAAGATEAKKEGETAAPAEKKSDEVEKIIAERDRIEKENRRKLDEYNDLLKKGEENVKDLNLRFGDWYFVVDDDVFQKIRLGREDVIKKKDKPKTEGAATPADPNTEPGATPAGLPAIPGATE
jgi:hypothetical protein